MNEYLRKKGVVVSKEMKNWSYILENEDQFSQLGYKFIQTMNKDGVLKSTKIRYNGQVKLIYFTEGYQNIISVLANISPNEVWNILGKLIAGILKIKNYGFLTCENIDITPERIYVDTKTYEPHLIYLPLVAESTGEKEIEFSNVLKKNLILALQMANNALVRDRENELLRILSESTNDLGDILKNIVSRTGKQEEDRVTGEERIELVSTDSRIPIHIRCNKEIISVGRSKDNDVVIDFTNKISRHHFRLKKRNGIYYLTDMESTAGTYVNDEKCIPMRAIKLKAGDIVQIPYVKLVVKKL